MWLIVGLAIRPEYQWTPHNLGFLAVDRTGKPLRNSRRRPEGKALVGRGKLAGQDVLLAKPQTYMNLSGVSVRELLGKYELTPDDLLVMWDEVQLPWSIIRLAPDEARQPQRSKSVIARSARRNLQGCGWVAGRTIRWTAEESTCCGR